MKMLEDGKPGISMTPSAMFNTDTEFHQPSLFDNYFKFTMTYFCVLMKLKNILLV
jgi:hypothetical protein